jgi:hypothetical protein
MMEVGGDVGKVGKVGGEVGRMDEIGRLADWEEGGGKSRRESRGQDEELTGEDAQAWRRRGGHDRNWQEGGGVGGGRDL